MLTGFLLGASAGVLCGGIVADRTREYTLVMFLGLAGSASAFVFVAQWNLPATLLIGTVSAAGFLIGITMPSRDLLVRSATPKGATGRVFGFVYSGLDVGSAFAPVTVGLMLDLDHPRWALWLVAAILLAAIFTAVSIRSTVGAPARAVST